MIIVTNSLILKNFKTIDEFNMSLGESLTKEENLGDSSHPNYQTVFKIRDPFVRKYYNMTNKFIFKYGNIGTLNIYRDQYMDNNLLLFFTDDERVYTIIYDNNQNFRSFINKSLDKVINMEIEDKKIEYVNKESFDGIKSTKDMTKEELIEYLVKKRNNDE
jgi:hypothetical protein